ncbi:hypothetical protein [Ideonella sp.]|uniref:hypothetical protein n=1 Tax=Ideonella sp. TaxID=1929293 RepID=UPI0035B16A63
MNLRYLAPPWSTLVVALGTAHSAEPPHSLQLTAQTEQADAELGEPIYLTVRLHNLGADAAEVTPLLDPEDGHVSVLVDGPSGRRLGYLPLSLRDTLGSSAPTRLAPGQSVSATLPIFFGASGWTFTQPGAYRVRASYRTSPDAIAVESATLTIEVRPGEADLRSLLSNDEASNEAGKFLVWRSGDHLTKGRALLKALTEQGPDSRLRDHYRVAEARSWSHGFRNYVTGQAREADFTQTLQALEGVREDRLPGTVRVEKLLAEAAGLYATGQPQAASATLARANALVDAREELGGYLPPVRRLREEMAEPPAR